MITYRDNLPDFKRQMEKAGKDFVPIVGAASRAAAREFAKEVRKFAPRDTGKLSRAVVIKRARRVPRGTIQYIVGIRQGKSQQRLQRKRKGKMLSVDLDAFYWRFLEGGWIPRGAKGALRGGRRTKALQARRGRASGARRVRYPFLQPAFTSASGRALSAFYSAMGEGVKRLNK